VIDTHDARAFLIRMLRVHRSGFKNGVGQYRLANWPTSHRRVNVEKSHSRSPPRSRNAL